MTPNTEAQTDEEIVQWLEQQAAEHVGFFKTAEKYRHAASRIRSLTSRITELEGLIRDIVPAYTETRGDDPVGVVAIRRDQWQAIQSALAKIKENGG